MTFWVLKEKVMPFEFHII